MALKQKLTLDHAEYRRNLRQATEDMKRFSRDAKRHGKDVGEGFERGARDASNAWEREGSKISRTLDRLKTLFIAVFAVEGIRRFLTGIVNVNAELQNLRNSFAAVTPNADALLERIRTLSRDTPQRFREMAESARQLLLTGVSDEEGLVGNLRSISDAASAINPGQVDETVSRISRALGQISQKGKVSAEEMLQLTEAGVPAWELLANAVGKTTGEVQEMTSKGLIPAGQAVDYLVEGMGDRFAGAAERASRTFTGRISTIKDTAEEILGDVGSIFFRELSGDVGDFADGLQRLRQSADFKATIRSLAEVLSDLYNILKTLAPLLAALAPIVARFGVAFAAVKIGEGTLNSIARFTGLLSTLKENYREARDVGPTVQMFVSDEQVDAMGRADRAAQGLAPTLDDLGAKNARLVDVTTRFGHSVEETRGPLRRMGAGIKGVAKRGAGWITAMGLWPVVIAAVGAAVVTVLGKLGAWGRELDENTEKVKTAAAELRDLADALREVGSASQAGARSFELKLEIPDAEQIAEQMLQGVPDEYEVRLRVMNAEDLNRLAEDALNVADDGFLSGWTSGDDVQRVADALGIDRQGSDARPFDKETFEAIGRAADALGSLKSAQDALNETTNEYGETLDFKIAELQARVERMQGMAGSVFFDQGELKVLQDRLDVLLEKRRELTNQSVTTTTTGGSDTDVMSEREIARQLELLAVTEELNSALQEVHQTEDALADARKAQAAGVEDADDLVETLERELQLKKDAFHQLNLDLEQQRRKAEAAKEMEEVYKNLPEHAKALVDEMGGLEAMIDGLDISLFDDMGDDAVQIAQTAKSNLEDLNAELADIQQRQTAGIISPEDAEAEAKEVRDRYLVVFQDLYKKLKPLLESLPKAVGEMLKGVLDEFETAVGETGADTPTGDGFDPDNMRAYATAALDVANAMGAIGDESHQALRSVVELGAGIANLASGNTIAGVAGIASGLIGLLSDSGPSESELKDAIRDQIEALKANTDALLGGAQVGSSLTREQVDRAVLAMERVAAGTSTYEDGRALEAVGIDMDALMAAFASGIALIVEKESPGDIDELSDAFYDALITGDLSGLPSYLQDLAAQFPGLQDVIDELNENLGEYSDTVAGVTQESDDRQRFEGLEGQAAYDAFIADAQSIDGLSPEALRLLQQAQGLDLSTEAGQQALARIIAQFYNLDDSGLSADDARELLSGIQDVADGVDVRDSPSVTRSVASLSTLTEYQGEILLGIQREALYALRQLVAAGRVAGGPPIPSVSSVSMPASYTPGKPPTTKGAGSSNRSTETKGQTNEVNISINGLGVFSIDQLMSEIDRRVRTHPKIR
jgi:tape measure domain-containing protein